MSESFDKLRRTVLAELRRQRADAGPQGDRAKRLGLFLDECLKNLGRSRAEFARQLEIERELADAILDGLLPESEIDDEFLAEMARAVNYEPNVLRVMLGRDIKPSIHEDNV